MISDGQFTLLVCELVDNAREINRITDRALGLSLAPERGISEEDARRCALLDARNDEIRALADEYMRAYGESKD